MTETISLGENGEFTLNLTLEEIQDIESKTHPVVFDLPEGTYEALSQSNKEALYHLIKAADILNGVFLKQDHPDNLRAKAAFERAAAADPDNALIKNHHRLFQMFNGLEGKNLYAAQSSALRVFKDKALDPGRGFYEPGTAKEDIIPYILEHPEQASAILGNNTVVRKKGNRLSAVPYSMEYEEDMQAAAAELFKAAKATDHEDFAHYLQLQAQALTNDSDAKLVADAASAWAKLDNAPLEFTVSWESAEDKLSSAVANDPRVEAVLEENGIRANGKNSLGVRVGIVNPESRRLFQPYLDHLESFKREIPYNARFVASSDIPGLSDVDIVTVTGEYAAIRYGITSAQNLPNQDKLSTGNRVVFHKQVRESDDPEQIQKLLDTLVNPEQKDWYGIEPELLFLAGHELGHSLGPRTTQDGRNRKTALGDWGGTIEENKGDLMSILMTGYLVRQNAITREQANEVYLTWVVNKLPRAKPAADEPHRLRAVMQFNYLRERGAIELEAGGKLSINPGKMTDAVRAMLGEVIDLQLKGDAEAAATFAEKYSAWNDALDYVVKTQSKLEQKRYRLIRQPARDRIMQEFEPAGL